MRRNLFRDTLIFLLLLTMVSHTYNSGIALMQVKTTGLGSFPNVLDPIRAPPSSKIYLDTRPTAPKGFLCFTTFGRLNNHILFTLKGISMAMKMNRTFLVPSLVGEFYDMDRLAIEGFANWTYKPLQKTDDTCNINATNYTINRGLLPSGRIMDYDVQTAQLAVTAMNAHDAWHWMGWPSEEFYQIFYRNLYLAPKLHNKAKSFIQERLPGSFLAVHLRWLEGKCDYMADDKTVCCPSVDVLLEQAKARGIPNAEDLPIFVADDRQCKPEIRESYITRNAIIGYTSSDCEGSECAALDFEICTYADFFLGNFASTGDANIREWRTERQGYHGSLSVLSLKNTTVAKENSTALTRFYRPGYWKWIRNCSEYNKRQRKQFPCL